MKGKVTKIVFSMHEVWGGLQKFTVRRSDFDENGKLLDVTEFEGVHESLWHAREELDRLYKIAEKEALDHEEETGEEGPDICFVAEPQEE